MTLRTLLLIVFVSSSTFICPNQALSAQGEGFYTVEDIVWKKGEDHWVYTIKGNQIPAYTRYELFSPHRLRLDIAEGAVSEELELPLQLEEGPVGTIRGKAVADEEVNISRLEFLLEENSEYIVQGKGNDILIKVASRTEGERKAEKAGKGKEGEKHISAVNFHSRDDGLLIEIDAGSPIHSLEATEIAVGQDSPPRLMIDIDTVGTERLALEAPENAPVSGVKAEPYEKGSRLWLDSSSSKLFDYKVITSENGLHIKVHPPGSDTDELLAAIAGGEGSKKRVGGRQPREIAPRIQKTRQSEVRKEASYQADEFSQAGYSGEKITVDFYQSNLHNVFRLIGEVSGRNIIVAEGVSGTLTLSLKEVPWDFMLDIILNLKNLNKEEQFNTIIISPANKKFKWPGQDQKEDLVIRRPATVSRDRKEAQGKMQTAQLLRRAKSAEETGNYEEAVDHYEELYSLAPERGDIAARITSLALTKLDLNAKAAHYGKIATRLEPENNHLALLTATALARTGKPQEAVKYYELATDGPHPPAQALAAYAAFSEEYRSYQMAIELWNRYEKHYGSSLETMVTRARISDLLGKEEQAEEIYRRVKLSGYNIPSDLAEYINHRLGD